MRAGDSLWIPRAGPDRAAPDRLSICWGHDETNADGRDMQLQPGRLFGGFVEGYQASELSDPLRNLGGEQ